MKVVCLNLLNEGAYLTLMPICHKSLSLSYYLPRKEKGLVRKRTGYGTQVYPLRSGYGTQVNH